MRPAEDLIPPSSGPASDPVLYGVAEGLRSLFTLLRDQSAKAEASGSEQRHDDEDR